VSLIFSILATTSVVSASRSLGSPIFKPLTVLELLFIVVWCLFWTINKNFVRICQIFIDMSQQHLRTVNAYKHAHTNIARSLAGPNASKTSRTSNMKAKISNAGRGPFKPLHHDDVNAVGSYQRKRICKSIKKITYLMA
jgi:hypothetical protein